MARRARSGRADRWLLLVFLLPALFLFFGARSALYRYEQQALSEPADAIVKKVDHETYSYRDSDGRTQSGEHWSYLVEFESDGQAFERQVVEPNFDPEMIWHNSDSIDPDIYAEGARMPVLLRRDLDYAVAHDDFWAIYGTPIFLSGFGFFSLLICLPVIFILRSPMPEASAMTPEELFESLKKRKEGA